MRSTLLCTISALFIQIISCQNTALAQEKCLSQVLFNQLSKTKKEAFDRAEKNATKFDWNNNLASFKNGSLLITIPVVVHVVYNPLMPGSNLSEETIRDQIAVINEDFRRLNADRNNTRAIFDSLGADVQIAFVLAKRDPDGLPTNGITRTPSALNYNPLLVEDFVKSNSTGGHDAWPADQYLNIWTCDMSLIASQFVIGYAQFPGGDPATDGIVVQWQYFGRNNAENLSVGSKGRTTTHEIGHWLGLRHIWGDGSCADDFVADTPHADGASSGCDLGKNSCNNEDLFWNGINPPDMVENYMDYSGDACMNLFTKGQKARMLSFLYTDSLRKSLFTSDKGMDAVAVNEAMSNNFEMYPNPAYDVINFELSGEKPKKLSIYNVFGQIVFSGPFEQHIEISTVPNGMYQLEFSWANGQSTCKQLVVQHSN